MCRVGVGLVLPSKRYNVSNAVAKLRELLDMRAFAKRALNVALRMRSEDGTQTSLRITPLPDIEGLAKTLRNNWIPSSSPARSSRAR